LKTWTVHLASKLARNADYQEILSELPSLGNPYLSMELADMEWFRKTQGTGIKLGWTSSATPHDEKWFDAHYREYIGLEMAFPYTKAGRTVRGNAVPPYSHVEFDNDRLLIRVDEQIEEKFERMPKKVRNYYAHLTNMFQSLGYSLSGRQTPERLREMYEVLL